MSVFQADLSIKTAIQLGLEDIKKNPWLIDDMLSDVINNAYLKDKYGQKQIDSCKEWFANNNIDIYMGYENSHNKLPCITVMLGSSQEKEEMKHMADISTETVVLLPNTIGKPIPYVVKPFVPESYDDETGILTIPDDTKNSDGIAEGMILVDPENGTGYVIKEVLPDGVVIDTGLEITAKTLGVVPQFQFYTARVEHTFFQETYTVGCHVHGDPQALLWLHMVVLFALLRYREGLLEANGFAQSVVSSSDMVPNDFFTTPGGEKAWSRYITLTGQVENTWIKTPRRSIESVSMRENVKPTKDNKKGFVGGIKILSNLDSPKFINKNKEVWYTDAEFENDPNDPEDQEEQS